MNWSEPKKPIEGKSYYDHVTCETPLGEIKIEWKSWKSSPDYGVEIDGIYIGTEYGLEEAKTTAKHYLTKKSEQLKDFLS